MQRGNKQLPNLDKILNNEEDQDFPPLAGSNLAAIFGTSQKPSDLPAALKPPVQKKQATNAAQTAQTGQKPNLIMVKPAHAYKPINGQYSLVQNIWITLLGNAAERSYLLVLYKSKQEAISMTTLSPDFSYKICQNRYALYNDDRKQNWLILFADEQSCDDFAREICVSKFHSQPSIPNDSVFFEDLNVVVDGYEAKENDEITVKSTIITNLVQPLKFENASTQTMNVEISKDDNWERSLLNCRKGLRRLLILPPVKQISLGPGFPKDRAIIMQVEIMDIVKADDRNSSAIDSSLSTGKAALISRMAKIGRSIRPTKTLPTTDSDDTEDETRVISPRRFKPEVSNSPSQKHQSRKWDESSTDSEKLTNAIVPRGVNPTNVPLASRTVTSSPAFPRCWSSAENYPLHQTTISHQSIPAALDPTLNVFLSETRTQNTEIRIGMSKIADNVQKLLDKFHLLEVQNASSPSAERAMETSLKMLMALNAQKIDSRFENISNIPKPFESDVAGTESRSNDFEKEKKLEMDLKKAKELLEEHAVNIGKLEGEKRDWSEEKREFKERIENLEKALKEEQEALKKVRAELETAKSSTTEQEQKNNALEKKIDQLEEKLREGNLSLQDPAPKISINEMPDKTAEIKRIMNKTYKTLAANFTEESYSTNYIKRTLATTIRDITLQVLEEGDSDAQWEDAPLPKINESSLSSLSDSSVIPEGLSVIGDTTTSSTASVDQA